MTPEHYPSITDVASVIGDHARHGTWPGVVRAALVSAGARGMDRRSIALHLGCIGPDGAETFPKVLGNVLDYLAVTGLAEFRGNRRYSRTMRQILAVAR